MEISDTTLEGLHEKKEKKSHATIFSTLLSLIQQLFVELSTYSRNRFGFWTFRVKYLTSQRLYSGRYFLNELIFYKLLL